MKSYLAVVSGAVAVLGFSVANAAIDDKKAEGLMKKGQCATCHALDKRGVGPAYKDVAAKRKKEKDAAAMLARKVRDGGSGAYGPVPMPPNPRDKIGDDELKLLIEWILSK